MSPSEIAQIFETTGDHCVHTMKWCKLPLYMKTSLQLPTTKQNLELQFGDNVDDVLSTKVVTFLIDTYSAVAEHCNAFQKVSQQVASLANDLVSYVRDTETYYPTVNKHYDTLYRETDPGVLQPAANDIRRMFTRISDCTKPLPSKVQSHLELVQKFTRDSRNDQRLVSELNERVAQVNVEAQQQFDLIKRIIEEKRTSLGKLYIEYPQASQKCQSVPWSAWVPVVGWIAGAIVAEQASTKAQAAGDEILQLHKDLEALDMLLSYADSLKATAEQIYKQVKDVSAQIAGAMESLTIIVAAWEAMVYDVEKIMSSLTFWLGLDLVDCDLEFARRQKNWAELGKLADDVFNAFVGVSHRIVTPCGPIEA